MLTPAATALRASIVIGARSSSFRILVRLVERLRLPDARLARNRTQPVAGSATRSSSSPTPSIAAAAGRSLDIAGPDVLSYGEMIERIAESMGVARLPIGLGFSPHPRRARRGERA